MGVPAIFGVIAGPYSPPPGSVLPPITATILGASTRVLIKGSSVALFPGPTQTSAGPIIFSTLNTVTTLVEGQSVILGGSLTTLASGYHSGPVAAIGAIGVLVN